METKILTTKRKIMNRPTRYRQMNPEKTAILQSQFEKVLLYKSIHIFSLRVLT